MAPMPAGYEGEFGPGIKALALVFCFESNMSEIVCNPLYTAYFTKPSNNRLTVVDVLRGGRPRRFLLNEEALGYVEEFGLAAVRRKQLDGFLNRYWKCYHEFLAYREQPMVEGAARLERKFDKVFSTVTGYDALDERIAKTRAKKDSLLMVLSHPEIPLHTNDVELGARGRVRKRDVSLGPRTREGVEAWDTFATLAATATKLDVSFYHYIHDRVSGAYEMPALADLIVERAADLNLGASWDGT